MKPERNRVILLFKAMNSLCAAHCGALQPGAAATSRRRPQLAGLAACGLHTQRRRAAAAAADVAVAVAEGEGAVIGRPLHTAAAWTAAEALAQAEQWQHVLTPVEVQEVLAATRAAVASGKPIPELSAADFPLPTLGPVLERQRREALCGRGFQLLRGERELAVTTLRCPTGVGVRGAPAASIELQRQQPHVCLCAPCARAGFPVEQLSRQEVVTAFYGVGCVWGNARSQNAKGHVIGHVKDLGLDPDSPEVRVYATRIAQVVGAKSMVAAAEQGQDCAYVSSCSCCSF